MRRERRKPRYKRWEVTFELILPRNITQARLETAGKWVVQVFTMDGYLIPMSVNKIRAELKEELNVFSLDEFRK